MEVIALKRSTDIQEYNAGEYDITAVKLNKSLEGILNKYGEYLQEKYLVVTSFLTSRFLVPKMQ